MLSPAGYWYIIAYEAIPSAPSTWGAINYSWRQFAYYDAKPIAQGAPESLVVGAQLAHDAAFAPHGSQKGAVRAYWWDGRGWVLQRYLDRDWGPRGLVGEKDEPPAPQLPGASPEPVATSTGLGWLWVPVVAVVGVVFWDVTRGKHWDKARPARE